MTPTHLLVHRYTPGTGPQPGTPGHDDEMRQWAELDARLRADGILIGAFAVQDRGAEVTREAVATWQARGDIVFAIHAVAADGDDDAAAIARAMPTAAYGAIEVRPLMDAT